MTMSDADKYVLTNIEALADDEAWKGKKLKVVDCVCPTTHKTGTTAKCEKDGTLEDCTKTQQGPSACYKLKFLNVTVC